MAELPILPLKTDALLADTSHMSAEEFGAYMRILLVMWRHGGKLMEDETELARIAGVDSKRWMKISERVLRPLTIAGGFISQKRLTDTWLQVQAIRKKRALAAESRWSSKRDANALHMDMQMHSKWNANQNQTRRISSEYVAARPPPVEKPQGKPMKRENGEPHD